MQDKDIIFALDIGTRKVMGVVARPQQGYLEIMESYSLEHQGRPMLDGQIHDIGKVTDLVKEITSRLQERLGFELEKVGVAVAGRNLLTFKGTGEKIFETQQEVNLELVRELELMAVESIISGAQEQLGNFHCVGYSPLYAYIDGARFFHPLGHRGKSVKIEVIATFLPQQVLESMLSVCKESGLEPVNITLEPIAAMQAIVPQDMRHLNIILVDIGAGTSDLALSRQGAVVAYGMVPEAGDEVTEAISQEFAVDFSMAEHIKRLLTPEQENANSFGPKIYYTDLWGRSQELERSKVEEVAGARAFEIADVIAKEALRLNGGKPHAVICIGGGSLTYGLVPALARSLGIAAHRVGVRLPSLIPNIRNFTHNLTGPEAVTPLGITLMTSQSCGINFIEVKVNGKLVRQIDFKQKKDLLNALILAGYSNRKLYPRVGLALTYELNGESCVKKGTLGKPAKIFINGKEAGSLSEQVNNGDEIVFEEARPGEDARASAGELADLSGTEVLYNGKSLAVYQELFINGLEAGADSLVIDRDCLQVKPPTIKKLLRQEGVELGTLEERQILVNINGSPRIITQGNFTLTVNGKESTLDTFLTGEDQVLFSLNNPRAYRIKDVLDLPESKTVISVEVNGKEFRLSREHKQIFMNGQRVKPEEFLIDGAEIRVYDAEESPVLLSELFRYIDFSPEQLKGKLLKFFVNDIPAGYTTLLTDGSRVKIILKEREE